MDWLRIVLLELLRGVCPTTGIETRTGSEPKRCALIADPLLTMLLPCVSWPSRESRPQPAWISWGALQVEMQLTWPSV